MTPAAARFLFESLAAFGPGWSALLSGFAVIGWDGRLYLTSAGEAYLEGLET